jgi:hypothetical protein
LLSARWNADRNAGELLRELRLERRIEELPGREVPPDEVLPHPALRLVERRRDAVRERRPRERRVDLVLVDPVAELVEAREDAVDAVLVEARRQPDVQGRHRGRERVHRLVEPPRGAVHPPPLEDGEREAALRVRREGPAQTGIVDRCGLADGVEHRDERGLQLLEDRLDLRGLHPRLVVVEDDVVRIVLRAEAPDVLPAQLEAPLEVRQENREVLLLARLEPGAVAERAGAREIRSELRRHARRLVVVPLRHADEARLERVVAVLLLESAQLLEQLAELRRHLELVRDPVERRALLGTRCRAARRHLRLLVPREEAGGLVEIVDLAHAAAELVEAVAHERSLTGSQALSRVSPPTTNQTARA